MLDGAGLKFWTGVCVWFTLEVRQRSGALGDMDQGLGFCQVG